MSKKWYKVTFYAEMTDEDVKAMKGCFFAAMSDAMEISNCEGLKIEEDTVECNDTSGMLYLEYDAYELDLRTGDLKIDKQIFDDFEADYIITICFVDEDNVVNDYVMRREDDEYIYCEFFGAHEDEE